MTPDEIASRQFLVGLRGYDRDEVTVFLRQVAEEVRGLQEQVGELESTASSAASQPAAPAAATADPFTVLSSETRRILEAAEEAGRAVRQRAEQEAHTIGEETKKILQAAEEAAAAIRSRAEEQARGELEQANRKATTIVVEGERRRSAIDEEIRGLEEVRDRLSGELRQAADAVRAALSGLEAQGAGAGGASARESETPASNRGGDDGGGEEPARPGAPPKTPVAAEPTLEGAPTSGRDRESLLAELRPDLLRRVKRALQDVHNVVLEALQRGQGAYLDALLPSDDDLEPVVSLTAASVAEAYAAGRGPAADDGAPPAAVIDQVVATFRASLRAEVTEALTSALRVGLDRGEDRDGLSERIAGAFSSLRGEVVETLLDQQLATAYERGARAGGAGG